MINVIYHIEIIFGGGALTTLLAGLVRMAEKGLAEKPFWTDLYMRPYQQVVRREIELAGLQPGERVLHIGAGSVPFTAVHLARQGKVRVTAIDRDQSAVARGSRCVQKLGLANAVRISGGEGADCSLAGYSAVFIALQAAPKLQIFRHLFRYGPPGLRVVARQPRSTLAMIYDSLPPYWEPVGRVTQDKATFSHSVLYIV